MINPKFLEWLVRHSKTNFDEIPMDQLGPICQRLGRSGRGDRGELTQRIKQALQRIEDANG